MSRMKTRAMLCGALLWATQVSATDIRTDSDTGLIAKTFAACAGRYSAEVEHGWLMRTPGNDKRAAYRAAFIALVDASAPEGGQARALNHRISAKAAHADLLHRAAFGPDERSRLAARGFAQQHLATCAGLLLGG